MTVSTVPSLRGFSMPDVRERVYASARSLWIGAASFEDRCVAGLSRLHRTDVTISHGVILDYSTKLDSEREGDHQRTHNLQLMRDHAAAVFRDDLVVHPVDAYSFADFAAFVRALLASEQADLTIIDITCLTKIHALALATELARLPPDHRWLLAYTLPENYAAPDGDLVEGWRDVIIAPLAQSARLLNEKYSRGIVLLGHEADRLVFALTELEPSGGLIIQVDTPRRPDWKLRSAAVNRRTINRLTKMRFADWHLVSVDPLDHRQLTALIATQLDLARDHGAPLILFPFGPKALIVAVALQLVRDYDEASWFVYPVPQRYDAGYTEGIAETRWFGMD